MTLPASLDRARFNMIEQQIRPWDVLDAAVLKLLSQVHREDFVPLAHKALAFVDMELPLVEGGEEAVRQGLCMLAPKVQARLLQDLHVRATDSVLEIGTGSGYMAALLAHQAQKVLTLEINPSIAQAARANLQKAGLTQVEVREADGSKDVGIDGPFDVILLSGSVAQVPDWLLAKLKPGGRLAAITGFEPMMRATFITRTGTDTYTTTQPWDTMAPRLAHFDEPSKFSF